MSLHDVVGLAGVALIMAMYVLLQTGRTSAARPSFSIGNAVGSALILYSLAFDFNFAAALIEVFWLAFYKASDFVNLANDDPMRTWRDHADIVDAIETGDLVSTKDRLERHYEGIMHVIALNKLQQAPRED